MRRIKKVISVVFSIVLIVSLVSTNVSAAFYTKTIKNSSDLTSILNLVKSNDGDSLYEKIKYIFYNSQFAAATNGKFPYLNSGSSYNYVIDNGVKYTLSGYSRGCYLYADYVSQYVYGISSHSNKCVTVKINSNAGSMTAAQVQNAITLYAQAGEHIRIDNTHSIAFVAYDNNGFYYTSYATDSDPKIYVRYTTWSNFANECNGYSKIAMIYDIDRSTNSTNSTVTVQNFADNYENDYYDTNAILHGQVHKPKSYPLTEFGIRIRKTSGSYSDADAKFYKHNSNPAFNNYIEETYARCWFDINAELNMTLTHDTSYTYQIYAKVNGTEYFSEERTFSTTGSHSFGAWNSDAAHHWHNCSGCGYVKDAGAHVFSNACDTSCNTCGRTRTTTHKYDNDCDENCNVCGTFRETYHPIKITITKTTHIIECANGCDVYFENNHEYDNDSDNDCNICGGMRVIEHKYDNNADTTCNICGATAYPGGNTLVQEDGIWYHVVNREKVSDTTLVKYNNEWFYVKDGVLNRSNTLHKYTDGKWYHVNGGKWVKDTTLVQYNGTWYYVKDGRVDFVSNTLVKYNNQWYHVKGGKWVKNTTLVQYNGTWYYVKDGRVSFSSTTLTQYNGTWYYVNAGKVDFKSNTLVKYNNQWYHVNGGKWVKDTTLVKYNGTWYYVKDGRVSFSSTTLVQYNGTWYYVNGGKVDFNYTGNVKYNGKTYKVVKGKLV